MKKVEMQAYSLNRCKALGWHEETKLFVNDAHGRQSKNAAARWCMVVVVVVVVKGQHKAAL